MKDISNRVGAAPVGVATDSPRASSPQSVELFHQHQDEIGCVLCDAVMPRMDGWATQAALRQLAPDLPVVLASGYDEAQIKQGDHPERPQAFLKKPFELEACIKMIHLLTTPRD